MIIAKGIFFAGFDISPVLISTASHPVNAKINITIEEAKEDVEGKAFGSSKYCALIKKNPMMTKAMSGNNLNMANKLFREELLFTLLELMINRKPQIRMIVIVLVANSVNTGLR